MVERITGVKQNSSYKSVKKLGKTSAPNKTMTHLYALGFTEHTIGTQNIRSMAMIQLLLGNMGMPGGGINDTWTLKRTRYNRYGLIADVFTGLYAFAE